MRFFVDFLRLFYPNLCLNCSDHLLFSEKVLCTVCNNDLPTITIDDYKNNFVTNTLYGKIKIESGASFLYFKKGNISQKLIHNLKYNGRQDIGVFLGNWFGYQLKEHAVFKDIDYIIPVPIHSKKKRKRGYNQIDSFSKSISTILNIKYIPNLLVKVTNNTSQTFKTRFERSKDLEHNFKLTDVSLLKNKHILLVDDVITTGATLESCCKELLKTEKLKISILSIAFTRDS